MLWTSELRPCLPYVNPKLSFRQYVCCRLYIISESENYQVVAMRLLHDCCGSYFFDLSCQLGRASNLCPCKKTANESSTPVCAVGVCSEVGVACLLNVLGWYPRKLHRDHPTACFIGLDLEAVSGCRVSCGLGFRGQVFFQCLGRGCALKGFA